MTRRLEPMLVRRGYAVGAAPIRVGWTVHLVMLVLAFAGLVAGTVAMADVISALVRSS